MDELMRHQPLLRSSVMTSLIKVGSNGIHVHCVYYRYDGFLCT